MGERGPESGLGLEGFCYLQPCLWKPSVSSDHSVRPKSRLASGPFWA